ncbi:MAG: hypothetical protein J6D26_07110 [Clostridia bacterium]|nr:hypothetical protein [Clostridia bacterium]
MSTINVIVLWLLYVCIRKWFKWRRKARALCLWISYNTNKEPTDEELKACFRRHEDLRTFFDAGRK